MKMYSKNKKGFTLVEMILSLAIICIIGGVIAGICVSISNSFATTYNIDDSTDYAMLYANGFENSFLSKTCGQSGVAKDKWEWSVDPVNNIPVLNISYKDGTPDQVFQPHFISSSGSEGESKWEIRMFYKWDSSSSCVLYKIFVKDNYSRTHYVYMYEGSFWVPRYTERSNQNNVSATRKIYLDKTNGLPMESDTFTETYGWTDEEFAPIESQMDSSYYSKIVYEWG